MSLLQMKQGRLEVAWLQDKAYLMREVHKLNGVKDTLHTLAATITSDPITHILSTSHPDHYLLLTAR